MAFTTSIIPGANEIYYCKVIGFGKELNTVAPNEDQKTSAILKLKARILLQNLNGLLMQRHIAYCAMGYTNNQKSKKLDELQRFCIEISTKQPIKIFEFFVRHEDGLLMVCPARHGAINEKMKSLINQAKEELKYLR